MDFKKQDFGQESTVFKWNYQILSLHLVTVRQKVPILDFQSEFSMSKIIRVFFLQNCEKSKYRFLTFLPVTWVKIELQKGTIHQMNGWNIYFLVDFYAIVENSMWGALGPRMSNSSNHPLCITNFIRNIFRTQCLESKTILQLEFLNRSYICR